MRDSTTVRFTCVPTCLIGLDGFASLPDRSMTAMFYDRWIIHFNGFVLCSTAMIWLAVSVD